MDIIFSTPELERKVQRLVNKSRTEIGGWFLVGYEPDNWPRKFSYRRAKFLMGDDRICYINQILLFPNAEEARKQKTTYSPWDFRKGLEMVNATASLYGGFPIHFHSHPSGDGQPSPADIAFAGAWCMRWEGLAAFTILTPYPFRVWPYEIEWGKPNEPKEGDLKPGKFYSWHTKLVRELL